MTHEPNTEHVQALTVIIHKVNGGQRLDAAALAEAILAHPGSRWGPAQPAPWPELPEEPPQSQPQWAGCVPGGDWERGRFCGWQAARAELQRLREQAGAAPTPAPTLPQISDQLIKRLIGDVLAVAGTATERSCLNRYWNPVPEVRARLYEILQLAAQKAAKRPAL